ncbi:NADH-quinone oxidoreductase subunit C [Shimazuella alba]|uniref:NADH-quinone oxidoreductase subunit C n=1 Tax=Shimazuella alba TaxID=2690964 RepID=A0A6I4VMK4_9BACL|nr:NADH-quinone oxidoreductase subunit C [Shimazuella alba]MXQ52889.1 NADH-quinone oxidoreductase subunit C [Shimazuella alba]
MSEEQKKPPVRPKPAAKKVEQKPLPPSPKQPVVDELVALLRRNFGESAIVEGYINQPNDHLPTILISREKWLEILTFLRNEESLHFTYLQNASAIDYETHLEVVYHLHDLNRKERIAVKVKLDREHAVLPSASSLFAAANWNEREMYDLMGIQFTDHPELKRILLPDDWVGHPLRKDYEAFDEGV